ncbi:MAG TPA: NAD(P)/FAD-dependent oxidoreductase [Ktedonobacteraceae bacterium]|nr:NAD(P)/FAD-dependent oxidoreductase [Ktedonobacteraceae bacterium]
MKDTLASRSELQTREDGQQPVAAAQPRVVVVGAGFGGLEAVKALRHAPVQVTMIDRWNHHLFQPMLYQVATAGLSIEDIAAPIRSIFSRQANVSVMLAEVTGIDIEKQLVLTTDQAVPYDYLVLATGASSNYFGHDEWQRLAPSLKSLQDAMTLRHNILYAFEAAENEPDPEKRRALLTFVLVGGGATGVELAGAIAELAHRALTCDFRRIDPASTRIVLVEGEPRIIPTFPASLTHKARKKLEQFGVEVRTGVHVTGVTAEGVKIGDEYIAAKNVIWTAGVTASPAGKWLDTEVDRHGRVKVERDLTIPGHSNIFVIGDTACALQKRKPLPGLSPVAMQEGRYVAKMITDRVTGKAQRRPFRYVDKGTLATVGRSFAVVDIGPLRFTGLLAWLTWIVVHIFYLIGFRNRLLVLIQYAWAYVTFQPGARIFLPEERVSAGTQAEVVKK